MEIDILPTDTFVVDTEGSCSIRQVRDGQGRALGWCIFCPPVQCNTAPITRDLFIAIARAALRKAGAK